MPRAETFNRTPEDLRREEPSSTPPAQYVRDHINYINESPILNMRQREISVLLHLMRYDQTGEAAALRARIEKAERTERSSRRALWVMGVLTALATLGLGYGALFLDDLTRRFSRISFALGLAALISMLVLIVVWIVARSELDRLRCSCWQLVTKLWRHGLGILRPLCQERLAAPKSGASPPQIRRYAAELQIIRAREFVRLGAEGQFDF
jgi:hypothetical protein